MEDSKKTAAARKLSLYRETSSAAEMMNLMGSHAVSLLSIGKKKTQCYKNCSLRDVAKRNCYKLKTDRGGKEKKRKKNPGLKKNYLQAYLNGLKLFFFGWRQA